MKQILTFLVIIISLVSGGVASAQTTEPSASQLLIEDKQMQFLKDMNGSPIRMNSSYNVTGSPFFPKNYCTATMKVQKGKKYEDVSIKLNMEDNDVYVKFGEEKELVSTVQLEYIEFNGCDNGGKQIFRSGFPAVDKQTDKSYYQVLSDGNLLLLKSFNVSIRNETVYGSSTVTKVYETANWYYAYSPDKGIVRLKDNAVVLDLVPAQKKEAEKFISDQNIKVKREADLIKLFAFLNTAK